MQTKKDEIRKTILACAREEFINHGYEASSMRTIAKKANTSLGNIYHYFPNKKAVLNALIMPTVQEVCGFIKEHAKLDASFLDMKEINQILDQVNFEEPQMKALLSKEFVIFMQTSEPEYVAIREETILLFRKHIARHMHFGDANNHFVIIVTKMLIDCVIHMVSCNDCVHNKTQDIKEMFKIMCRSVAMQDCMELQDTKNPSKEINLPRKE